MGPTLENMFNVGVAAIISIIVLLLSAKDILDGDELWKGAIIGPCVVGACNLVKSNMFQSIFIDKIKRMLG